MVVKAKSLYSGQTCSKAGGVFLCMKQSNRVHWLPVLSLLFRSLRPVTLLPIVGASDLEQDMLVTERKMQDGA